MEPKKRASKKKKLFFFFLQNQLKISSFLSFFSSSLLKGKKGEVTSWRQE